MIPPRDGRVNGQLIENEQPEDRIKCSVQALRQENPEKDDRKTTKASEPPFLQARYSPGKVVVLKTTSRFFRSNPENNESRKTTTFEESGSYRPQEKMSERLKIQYICV